MAMIQMALYSVEDRKMTLKEITKWIEDTFPYYRHCGKKGWKVSQKLFLLSLGRITSTYIVIVLRLLHLNMITIKIREHFAVHVFL